MPRDAACAEACFRFLGQDLFARFKRGIRWPDSGHDMQARRTGDCGVVEGRTERGCEGVL